MLSTAAFNKRAHLGGENPERARQLVDDTAPVRHFVRAIAGIEVTSCESSSSCCNTGSLPCSLRRRPCSCRSGFMRITLVQNQHEPVRLHVYRDEHSRLII